MWLACSNILWYSHLIIIGIRKKQVFLFFMFYSFDWFLGEHSQKKGVWWSCLGELWERLHGVKSRELFNLRFILFSGLFLDVTPCLQLQTFIFNVDDVFIFVWLSGHSYNPIWSVYPECGYILLFALMLSQK